MDKEVNKPISVELQMPVSMAAVAVVVVLVFAFTAYATLRDDIYRLKEEAITLNHAEYNRVTGEWQWITNNPHLQ
jgi:hypothetical protein